MPGASIHGSNHDRTTRCGSGAVPPLQQSIETAPAARGGARAGRAAAASRGAGRRGRAVLAAVARSPPERHVPDGDPARRVERDEERQVEDRDSRPRRGDPRRVGRPAVPAHGGPGRCLGRGAARLSGRAAGAGRASLRRARLRPPGRQHRLAAGRRGAAAARGNACLGRHLRVELGDHGRRARGGVLRVERPPRVRHGRQPGVVEGSRRQAGADRGRRGHDAGAPRQPPGRRLGPQRPVVHRGVRQAHRRGAVADGAGRARYVVHPDRGRARGARAGRHQRLEPRAQLRPRDRRARLAHDRPDAA